MSQAPGRFRVRDFIVAFIGEKRYSPSYEEIAAALGYSSLATVHNHVSKLLRDGHLVKTAGFTRNLALPGSLKTVTCPNCSTKFTIPKRKPRKQELAHAPDSAATTGSR